MDASTELFLGAVDRLEEDDFVQASPLPGWTIADIVAHVHFNAEAIRRLVSWARTGVESAMYAGSEQRTAEIAHGATLPPIELRTLLQDSAGALGHDLDQLQDAMWSNSVVTAMGRTVPVSETLWMRTREVGIHAVDLGCGVDFTDLPDGMLGRLSAEILSKRHAAGEGAALAAWLSGRSVGAPLPSPWL
ncbi:MAG: maleylpyruvate isomerase family mycothiol-dependent enzyme [Actinobacteria bacterium]|nr:maleylpyruvate isomerase family mycothiol-dependent enzyme [Actinomycetota bacterium]